MKKIVLFGTGNLGKRYLQAILNSEGDYSCHCYDSSHEALDSAVAFLSGIKISDARLHLHYGLDEILGEVDSNTLVIVATTAGGRLGMINKIVDRRPEVIIIEKPVAQKRNEYQMIMDLCTAHKIQAYTHYTLRFQPYCKKLKEIIDGSGTFEFVVSLPAMGLACVGIHYIDILLWLFDISSPKLSALSFEGNYEQKRKGFYDMYGEAVIHVPGRGTGRLINAGMDGIRTIVTGLEDKVITVYEDQRIMSVMRKKADVLEIYPAEYRFASQYMTTVIENFLRDDINASGELVTLEEGYKSHRIIYDFMERTGNMDLNIT